MLTIKALSVAALVGATAVVTYTVTTVLVDNDTAKSAATDLNACNAALAEWQAGRAKTEVQEEAAKKYFRQEPSVLDQGRKF